MRSVPARGPRIFLGEGRLEEFRQYCAAGAGQREFGQVLSCGRERLASFAMPPEPRPFGDPHPNRRDERKILAWREAQDICGDCAKLAEAAAAIWLVTADRSMLRAAKDISATLAAWDPLGATGIAYNSEAHFRLWRVLPRVYDQIRDDLAPEDRLRLATLLSRRGKENAKWIRSRRVQLLARNSLAWFPESHSVRFMSATGMGGLALLGDSAEAADWLDLACDFYADRFPPWGGDDGGWSEGLSYWRAVVEHAGFLEALLPYKVDLITSKPFWRENVFFPLYFLGPQPAYPFGDNPSDGITLDDIAAEHLERHAALFGHGTVAPFIHWAVGASEAPELGRFYPSRIERLLRTFNLCRLPRPAQRPLSTLPAMRTFHDIGWVAMHTRLGQHDDLHVAFKSSEYGSYSHSHADQNAFSITWRGQPLLATRAFRDFHNSSFHESWLRQTLSKNCPLIGGEGQRSKQRSAKGMLIGSGGTEKALWAAGDATVAYRRTRFDLRLKKFRRDVIVCFSNVVIVLDTICCRRPLAVKWVAHAVIQPDEDRSDAGFYRLGADTCLKIAHSGGIKAAARHGCAENLECKSTWRLELDAGSAARHVFAMVLCAGRPGALIDISFAASELAVAIRSASEAIRIRIPFAMASAKDVAIVSQPAVRLAVTEVRKAPECAQASLPS